MWACVGVCGRLGGGKAMPSIYFDWFALKMEHISSFYAAPSVSPVQLLIPSWLQHAEKHFGFGMFVVALFLSGKFRLP